jgi:hypothetical protein
VTDERLPPQPSPETFDARSKARADALWAAVQAEWDRWSRKAPVVDRIIISAWVPSLESGDKLEIEAIAICLLEQTKSGQASESALRHLASLSLRACLERGFPPSAALIEIAALLLERKSPKHKRVRPEERQRAIAFIVENPEASRRAIAKAAGASEAIIRKWLSDPHFRDEANERAGRTILPSDRAPKIAGCPPNE